MPLISAARSRTQLERRTGGRIERNWPDGIARYVVLMRLPHRPDTSRGPGGRSRGRPPSAEAIEAGEVGS